MRQCGQGWPARPGDNSRIRDGQEEDNSKTREDKKHKTRHRARPPATEFRGAARGLVSVANSFFLRYKVNRKLVGEFAETYRYIKCTSIDPKTVSKRFVGRKFGPRLESKSPKRCLGTPYLPPRKANCLINDFCRRQHL